LAAVSADGRPVPRLKCSQCPLTRAATLKLAEVRATVGAKLEPDETIFRINEIDLKQESALIAPDQTTGFDHAGPPMLVSPEGAPLDSRVIEALTGHIAYAQAGAAAPALKIVGHVVKMTGSASIVATAGLAP
jgi:hypothetical protein